VKKNSIFIFTKEGRTAYLAFVRNLPSQIVLLSPCIFILMLKGFDWMSIAACFVLFLMFLSAAVTNVLEFFDAWKTTTVRVTLSQLRADGLSGWPLIWEMVRKNYFGFFEYSIIVLGFYGGFAAVVAMVSFAYHHKI
jgi:hypothetical protein